MPARPSRSALSPRVLANVASSVDAAPDLLPCFDDLFRGLEALGGNPTRVAKLLATLGVTNRHRVLDLASGKGATSIAVAKALGARVVGVDACETFVLHAQSRAARLNLSRRCTFILADVTSADALPAKPFDVAMMLGLFPVARAARLLRENVRPGGLYVIDDCFRVDAAPSRSSNPYASVPTLASHEQSISRLGDRIERIDIPAPSACRALDTRIYQTLARNASRLRRAHPKLAPSLTRFLRVQHEAIGVLSGPIRPAVWYVRRA